jgi:hypothetical protein
MTTMTLEVNSKALVSNLRNAFTSKTQFLSELLQNARRAGATSIKLTTNAEHCSLTIEDNGRGIESFQDLLSIANSGWDEATKASETPYGMGFLAALFAAESVIVKSRGQMATFDTLDAIGFKAIEVRGEPNDNPGTHITLAGLEPGLFCRYNSQLNIPRSYLDGFACEVSINGAQPVDRPHSLGGGLKFTTTPFGEAHLHGLEDGSVVVDTLFYLQGQLVHHAGTMARNCNVVHLDPTRFNGRLPDRACLIEADRDRALALFKTWFDNTWVARLKADRATMTPENFIDRRLSDLMVCKCMDLLNEVPMVPGTFLIGDLYYPVHSWNWDSEGERPHNHLKREDVEAGRIRVVVLDEKMESELGMAAHNLAYLLEDVVVLDSVRLPQDHWLQAHIIRVNHEDVSVELHGVSKICRVSGTGMDYPPAVFCDSITLSHPGVGSANTDAELFFLSPNTERLAGVDQDELLDWVDDRCYLIAVADKASGGSVVRQVYTFEDEFDVPDEGFCAQEEQSFGRFLMANRPGREIEAIREALMAANINELGGLLGKRFEVSIESIEGKPLMTPTVVVKSVG